MKKQTLKKIIIIDFDWVLDTYNGEFDVNSVSPIKEDIRELLEGLHLYYQVKIFTERTRSSVVKWLIKNDLGQFIKDVVNTKESAWVYIDGRGISFGGDYMKQLKSLEKFETWYKTRQQKSNQNN